MDFTVFTKFVNDFGLPWAVALVLAGVIYRLIWYILKETVSKAMFDEVINDKIERIEKMEANRASSMETMNNVVNKMMTMLEILVPLIQQSYKGNGSGRG